MGKVADRIAARNRAIARGEPLPTQSRQRTEQEKREHRHALRVTFIKRGYNAVRRAHAIARLELGETTRPRLYVRGADRKFSRLL